jgi:HIV Tat-specific factor 1
MDKKEKFKQSSSQATEEEEKERLEAYEAWLESQH